MWTDSHCHLDAPEFDPDRAQVVQRAVSAGVGRLVLPAVALSNFDSVRALAHAHDAAYALGIHPLCTGGAHDDDIEKLRDAVQAQRDDPRLVAIGEIGIDHFVPGLDRARQERFYLAQLRIARDSGLPVIVHVRRSADALLKGLRRIEVMGGIAHAFNGSAVQAEHFTARGFRLGFGGTLTFDRSLQIRERARTIAAGALVLETDSPDIPPQWLYRSAADRAAGATHRNEPAELPRIGAVLAELRGWSVEDTAALTSRNVREALPRLKALDA